MNQTIQKELVHQIADDISQAGYEVTVDPSRIPNRKMWQFDPPYLFRGLKHKPDLLIQHGDQFAVINVRTRPFLMGGVADAHDLSQYFGAPAIICLPDEVLPDIPKSVLRFADEINIQVAPFSALVTTLGSSFSSPPPIEWGGK